MSALTAAKDYQRLDLPVKAAEAYEAALAKETESLSFDDYLEAAVLYFVCTDFGYNCYKNLPEEFARGAYDSAKSWLKRALLRFGQHAELRFWELYFDYVILGGPPFLEECRRLAQAGGSLTPYFYLYSLTRDQLYKTEAAELYALVTVGETARQRYIRSVLAPLFKN